MSHPNYVWYLQLLLLKIFLDNQKEKISAQPKVCLSFSPCKLQPYFDCVCWSLLLFFPFAWWHSLSYVMGNIIHSVSIHGTSFSDKCEAKKFCGNTITICRGRKLIFGSQEGERTMCSVSKSQRDWEESPFEELHPVWCLFQEINFSGVEEVKGDETGKGNGGDERPKSFIYPLQQDKISPQQSGQPSPMGITSTEEELCDFLPCQLFPLWNEELMKNWMYQPMRYSPSISKPLPCLCINKNHKN